MEYKRDISLINSEFTQIEESFLESLTTATWVLDNQQVETLLKGILRMQDLIYVEIRSRDTILYSEGATKGQQGIRQTFPLMYRYNDKLQHLGDLIVVASLENVYGRLVKRFGVILVGNGIKTFAVAIFISFIFQNLISRHLGKIVEFSRALNFERVPDVLKLDRGHQSKNVQDELDDVVEAINDMRSRILSSHSRLSQSEERFRQVLENMTIGIVVADQNGTIEMFNGNASAIFGYSAEEMIGENIVKLMPADIGAEHHEYVQHYVTTGIKKLIGIGRQVQAKHQSGKELPIHLGVAEVFDGDTRKFVASITDLTEVKILEEHLQRASKMDAVGQLTGGIAHDFNNILGIIIGNLELLESKQQLNEEARKRFDVALRGANRGADLTRKLLSFSRDEQSDVTLVDVNSVIKGLEELLKRTLTATISIETFYSEEELLVEIDQGDFEDALVNLAINARDAMKNGGSLVIETQKKYLDAEYVRRNPESMSGQFAMVSISDDGSGMTAEIIDKIFEPFFTTKDQGQGTGLGLSMVYGFIKRSDGHLKVYSEPGRGTTFRLYFPLKKSAADSHEIVGKSAVKSLRGGTERVLVVEDEEMMADVAVMILQDYGYKVEHVSTAREALERLEVDPDFDLLFSDVIMPGKADGFELAEQVHRLSPSMKILLTSGFSNKIQTYRASNNSFRTQLADNLLSKPYNKDELIRRVRDVLDG
nr:PAS domain S-box protein [Sneathiella limimaris]